MFLRPRDQSRPLPREFLLLCLSRPYFCRGNSIWDSSPHSFSTRHGVGDEGDVQYLGRFRQEVSLYPGSQGGQNKSSWPESPPGRYYRHRRGSRRERSSRKTLDLSWPVGRDRGRRWSPSLVDLTFPVVTLPLRVRNGSLLKRHRSDWSLRYYDWSFGSSPSYPRLGLLLSTDVKTTEEGPSSSFRVTRRYFGFETVLWRCRGSNFDSIYFVNTGYLYTSLPVGVIISPFRCRFGVTLQ